MRSYLFGDIKRVNKNENNNENKKRGGNPHALRIGVRRLFQLPPDKCIGDRFLFNVRYVWPI